MNRSFATMPKSSIPASVDLVAFSHLRWNFVWQRPQHLMSRWAKQRRVFYVEEPLMGKSANEIATETHHGVVRVIPHLKEGEPYAHYVLRILIDELFRSEGISQPILWYWTPMFLPYTDHVSAAVTVYDCMDELSHFDFAPVELATFETELMKRADVMFTGGMNLYEFKRNSHPNIHGIPSSIDTAHFKRARQIHPDPVDQQNIPHPRIGFYGVIDERLDIGLIESIAKARPDWNFIVIGPTVKINPDSLPRMRNIHYLGKKDYDSLPDYIAGWDVAMMPFARNAATRFISPTKTPEFLAAGKPVVSTSIRDVVHPYEDLSLVHIADEPVAFIRAISKAMLQTNDRKWLSRIDSFLEQTSWDKTWKKMHDLISDSYWGIGTQQRLMPIKREIELLEEQSGVAG